MPGTTIDEHEKAGVRTQVFNHLSGMVLAPTVKALCDRNVFGLLDGSSRWLELDEIVDRTHGNRGYLRVAMRLLVSCGWLKQRPSQNGRGSAYTLTPEGVIATSLQKGIEARAFREDADPEQFAQDLYGVMLAYHHAARLLRDQKAEFRARRAFEALLAGARRSDH